jgi:hypothetical protein
VSRSGASRSARRCEQKYCCYEPHSAAFRARFINQVGDSLSDKRCDRHEHLIDASPGLKERHHSHRNVTIAHGDATISTSIARLNPTSFLSASSDTGDLVVIQRSAQTIDARDVVKLPLLADMPTRAVNLRSWRQTGSGWPTVKPPRMMQPKRTLVSAPAYSGWP